MNKLTPASLASRTSACGRIVFVGLLASASALSAQQSSSNAASADESDTSLVVLSPFEVNTQQDEGFGASESFTGGRLKTDLRDTPASVQVLTKEFLTTVGATNLNEASMWSTNTVSIGDRQAPGGAPLFNNNPIFVETRGSTVSGGTTGGSRQQRNYFPAFSDNDSYNLERFDFARGPNGILFGNGTIGGVSSAMTKRAWIDRNSTTIGLTVGSWSKVRGELDVNRSLGDKAAVRVSLMKQKADGWRLNDMDDREGLYATVTFKPFKDTEIRVDGEYLKTARQVGMTNIDDRVSGWDGVTTFDAAVPLATLPSGSNAAGVGRQNIDRYIFDPANSLQTIFNTKYQPLTMSGDQTSSTPIGSYVRGSLPAFNVAGASINHQLLVPPGRFDRALAGSPYFEIPSDKFTMSSDGPILTQYFRDVQTAITQRFGDFYVEVAGDFNVGESKIWGEQQRGTSTIYIDINQQLPDGSSNPNFLQPYGEGRLERKHYNFEHRNWRAAVAWQKDLGWVHISANVLGGVNKREERTETIFLGTALDSDTRVWGLMNNNASTISVRRYWNADSRPQLWNMGGQTFRFVDPVTNTGISSITPQWIHRTDHTDANKITTQEFQYVVAATHLKFWDDRLSFLAGVRSDEYTQKTVRSLHQGDYPTSGWDLNPIWRPDAPADYWDLTFQPLDDEGNPEGPREVALARPRLSNGLDPDPRYLNDRFQSDFSDPVVNDRETMFTAGVVAHLTSWFNPFINYAESFNPNITGRNLSGGQLEANRGKGYDFGVRAELFDHKLNLGITYYENQEANIWQSGDSNRTRFNQIINANAVGDLSEFGRNMRGYEPIDNYRDTVDRDNKGIEFEAVYSPLSGLRLIGNFGFPKTGSTNRFPHFYKYWDQNEGSYRQMVLDAGGLIDSSNQAEVDESIPGDQLYTTGGGNTDAQMAVDGWNGLQSFINSNPKGATTSGDAQASANFFADYTLQEGRFKGLRFGAGVQWRGRNQIGNRGNDKIPDPNNPNKNVDDPDVDSNDPVYSPSYYYVTATLGYTWQLADSRSLSLNLRVKNVLNESGERYINNVRQRPTDGDYTQSGRTSVPFRFNLHTPRSFELSMTLRM